MPLTSNESISPHFVVSSAEKNNIIAIELILPFKPWKHHSIFNASMCCAAQNGFHSAFKLT
jgi:hypothetical protein